MVKGFPKYYLTIAIILLAAVGQLNARSLGNLLSTRVSAPVSADKTSIGDRERPSPVVQPYKVHVEKYVKMEVTNIEDEDEDELNHDSRLHLNKKTIELGLFLNLIVSGSLLSSLQSSLYDTNFFYPNFSSRSLNIAYCVFRI